MYFENKYYYYFNYLIQFLLNLLKTNIELYRRIKIWKDTNYMFRIT